MVEEGVVAVMQQLMEISCRDSPLVREAGDPGGEQALAILKL